MRTGISSWCGAVSARPGRTRPAVVSRDSATPRTAPRWERSSRSTATRRAVSALPSSRGMRRRLRRGVAEWARPGRTRAVTASRDSATPRTGPRWERSSRSTPTRRALNAFPPSRGMRTGISSWCGRARLARDGHERSSVQGQRYASDGSAQGAQFQVNSYTTNFQFGPSVAEDADGDFVVAWSSQGSPGTDSSGYSVQGQRYASDGSALGAQFQVNSYTTSSQRSPSVAGGADGDFVVVWQSQGSPGTDTSDYSVQGQRYASDGSALGAAFQANSYTTSTQTRCLRRRECGWGFRRGVAESRLARNGHEQFQCPGTALRPGRLRVGSAVPDQQLHDERSTRPLRRGGCGR